jgi:hypothetical protein
LLTDLWPELDVGEMFTDGEVLSFEAEAQITKGSPVYLTADMKVSPSPGGDNALGIAVNSPEAGKQCSVCVRGIVKVTANGAITRGTAVCSAAGGKVTQLVDQAVDEGGSATYTIYYARKLGIALQTTSGDGDTFLIQVEK